MRRFLFALTLALGAGTAQAATLDAIEITTGGPSVDGSGGTLSITNSASDSTATYSVPQTDLFFTSLAGVSLALGSSLTQLDASFASIGQGFSLSGELFDPFLVPPQPPVANNFLLGTLTDVDDETGRIRALFETTGGSWASDFGSFFMLTIEQRQITDGTLNASIFNASSDSSAISFSLQAVQVVPLPAGMALLLGGLGGLAVLRRRKQVAA